MNLPAGALVSTEWLAANLLGPGLRIVDIRGEVRPVGSSPRYVARRGDYEASHIPGAVFVDWTRDIIDPDDRVPAQIAKPGPFAATMGALGVGDATAVVAYDDYHHAFAGRLAWALRYYGHDAVRILDGGWARWTAEGRPVSPEVPRPEALPFTPRPRESLRRTADEVQHSLENPAVLVIDARPAEQYAGALSVAARAGHIPGARNVPYARLVDPTTHRFLPAEELTQVFASAGVDVRHLPAEVVVYCNGGVTCTIALNALRLLGRDDVAVFDGSWNEWGNDPARPIHTGPKP